MVSRNLAVHSVNYPFFFELDLDYHNALAGEIERLVTVNRAFDAKLLVVTDDVDARLPRSRKWLEGS